MVEQTRAAPRPAAKPDHLAITARDTYVSATEADSCSWWSDYLHFRMRAIQAMLALGKDEAEIRKTISCDAAHVGRLLPRAKLLQETLRPEGPAFLQEKAPGEPESVLEKALKKKPSGNSVTKLLSYLWADVEDADERQEQTWADFNRLRLPQDAPWPKAISEWPMFFVRRFAAARAFLRHVRAVNIATETFNRFVEVYGTATSVDRGEWASFEPTVDEHIQGRIAAMQLRQSEYVA